MLGNSELDHQSALSDDEINKICCEVYRKAYPELVQSTSEDDLRFFTDSCYAKYFISVDEQGRIHNILRSHNVPEAFGTFHSIVGGRMQVQPSLALELLKIFCRRSVLHKNLIRSKIEAYRETESWGQEFCDYCEVNLFGCSIPSNSTETEASSPDSSAIINPPEESLLGGRLEDAKNTDNSEEAPKGLCTKMAKIRGGTAAAVVIVIVIFGIVHFSSGDSGTDVPNRTSSPSDYASTLIDEYAGKTIPLTNQNNTGTDVKGSPRMLNAIPTPRDPAKAFLEHHIEIGVIPASCRDLFDPKICTVPTTSPQSTTGRAPLSDRNNSTRFVLENPSQVNFYRKGLCNITGASNGIILEFSAYQETNWSSMNVDCFENLYGIKISGSMKPEDLHFVLRAAPNVHLLILEGDEVCESFYGHYPEEIIFSKVDLKHLRHLQFNNLSECLGLLGFFSNAVNLENLSSLGFRDVYANNMVSAASLNSIWEGCPNLEHFSFIGGQLCEDCILFKSRKPTLKSISLHTENTKTAQTLLANLTMRYKTKLEKLSTNVSMKSGDVDILIKRNPLLVDLQINFQFDSHTSLFLSLKNFGNLPSLQSLKLRLDFSETCRCVSQKDKFKLTNIRFLSVSSLSLTSNCKIGPGKGWKSLGMDYSFTKANGLWSIHVKKVDTKDVGEIKA